MRNGKLNKSEDRGEVQGQACHNKSHASRSTAHCLWCCNIKLLGPQSPALLRYLPQNPPLCKVFTVNSSASCLPLSLSFSHSLKLIILSSVLLPSPPSCLWALPGFIPIYWWVVHTRDRSSCGTTAATGGPLSRGRPSLQPHTL